MYIRGNGLKRSSHLFSSTQLRNGDVRFFCGSNDKSKFVWVALCSFLLENFFHNFFLLKYGFFRLNHWLSTLLCKSKLLYLPKQRTPLQSGKNAGIFGLKGRAGTKISAVEKGFLTLHTQPLELVKFRGQH